MCGILALFGDIGEYDIPTFDELNHRGPDHFGIETSENAIMAHYRLSIVDLTSNGDQPLVSEKSILIFNGEIYNYKSLLQKYIPGSLELTKSDSVALQKLLDTVGLQIISELKGMFAVVYKLDNRVFFFRDNVGIKPLYFYRNSSSLIISSEITPIKQRVKPKISQKALLEYIVHGVVLTDTIFEGVRECIPGVLYVWDSENCVTNLKVVEKHYNTLDMDLDEAIENVVSSMEAREVPSALLLSGGIDSSLLAHYLSKLKIKPEAITVDFGIKTINNELGLAVKLAEKLGLTHRIIKVEANDIKDRIEPLLKRHGQPFADAADVVLDAIYGTLKDDYKVVFQGDGGDEMFGGYSRHRFIKYSKILKKIPLILFSRSSRLTRILRALRQQSFFEIHSDLMREDSLIYDELPKLFNDNIDWYDAKYGHYKNVHKVGYNRAEIDRLFFGDKKIWLPKAFLKKVDIPSMNNSLEARVPFLHDDIQNFCEEIEKKSVVGIRYGKLPLRAIARRHLPREIYRAKKMGFGVPYKEWLANDFRDEYLELLDQLSRFNLIDVEEVRKHFILNDGSYLHFHWKLFILCKWLKNT